jgi:hypothetical protein
MHRDYFMGLGVPVRRTGCLTVFFKTVTFTQKKNLLVMFNIAVQHICIRNKQMFITRTVKDARYY